ncbi:MAG TPA: hypothetical protein VFQ61_12220, partial [Polyangiaceae bacterium]|nr:hypothetical protein [Polyangiaceae bacterium]
MTLNSNPRAPAIFRRVWPTLGPVLLLMACGADRNPSGAALPSSEPEPEPQTGPFKSLAVAARDSTTFTEPRAGVPLADGSVAFLAATTTEPERVGLFLQTAEGPRLLYAGD